MGKLEAPYWYEPIEIYETIYHYPHGDSEPYDPAGVMVNSYNAVLLNNVVTDDIAEVLDWYASQIEHVRLHQLRDVEAGLATLALPNSDTGQKQGVE